MKYCENPFFWQRRITREVNVGGVGVGGNNPIRVQTMLTSDTMNTEACVKEALPILEAGCEILRLTAPAIGDAKNLKNFVAEIRTRGFQTPIVADIHFVPAAAMEAALWVEKVRINPGNYADRKKFAIREYTDDQYDQEMDRLEQAFTPLVLRLKELGRALRIGTNHGSLSDRIMNRYGDTPLGMVESALEFVRISRKHNYHDIILSMKSSSTKVMIETYRLLCARLAEESPDCNYPLHLGVTEAGEGEDGRIKSAIGIGALLEDGLGDTVRVSLTEDSIHELPVCRELVKKYNALWSLQRTGQLPVPSRIQLAERRDPFTYKRRATQPIPIAGLLIGGTQPIRVEVRCPSQAVAADLQPILTGDAPVEILQFLIETQADLTALKTLKTQSPATPVAARLKHRDFFSAALDIADKVNILLRTGEDPTPLLATNRIVQLDLVADKPEDFPQLCQALAAALPRAKATAIVSIARAKGLDVIAAYRILAASVPENVPILVRDRACGCGMTVQATEDPLLYASTNIGALLCDGIGDAIEVCGEEDPATSAHLAHNILQAAGVRSFKAEYVACPSCGRTQFDLQTVTARIKVRTQHLKGVKIAVMGCIVNGPGEMADAHFGYVGTAPGKISLWVGKQQVKQHIPEEQAVDELVNLIKEHGKWVDAAS